MYLDINVGSAKHDTQHDIAHVNTLAGKIKDLTNKVEDIKREQRYMREVEEQFRNASETVNSKAVWWSIGQIVVLLGAAVWQMRYLKDYFGDKKLR
jgi:primase-polymerase (primpol)-like protein